MNLPPIDSHVHSSASPDANGTVREIQKRAEALGLWQVAIVDHCYTPSQVPVLASRSRTQRGSDTELILGVELSLEMPFCLEVLRERERYSWDIVSGAVHSLPSLGIEADLSLSEFRPHFRSVDPEIITRDYVCRSVEAIRTGGLDILAHPFDLFFYAGVCPKGMIKQSVQVVEAAAAQAVIIELNSYALGPNNLPTDRGAEIEEFRLDLYGSLLENCAKLGVPVSTGSDAHSIEAVGSLNVVEQFCDHISVEQDLFLTDLREKLNR